MARPDDSCQSDGAEFPDDLIARCLALAHLPPNTTPHMVSKAMHSIYVKDAALTARWLLETVCAGVTEECETEECATEVERAAFLSGRAVPAQQRLPLLSEILKGIPSDFPYEYAEAEYAEAVYASAAGAASVGDVEHVHQLVAQYAREGGVVESRHIFSHAAHGAAGTAACFPPGSELAGKHVAVVMLQQLVKINQKSSTSPDNISMLTWAAQHAASKGHAALWTQLWRLGQEWSKPGVWSAEAQAEMLEQAVASGSADMVWAVVKQCRSLRLNEELAEAAGASGSIGILNALARLLSGKGYGGNWWEEAATAAARAGHAEAAVWCATEGMWDREQWGGVGLEQGLSSILEAAGRAGRLEVIRALPSHVETDMEEELGWGAEPKQTKATVGASVISAVMAAGHLACAAALVGRCSDVSAAGGLAQQVLLAAVKQGEAGVLASVLQDLPTPVTLAAGPLQEALASSHGALAAAVQAAVEAGQLGLTGPGVSKLAQALEQAHVQPSGS